MFSSLSHLVLPTSGIISGIYAENGNLNTVPRGFQLETYFMLPADLASRLRRDT